MYISEPPSNVAAIDTRTRPAPSGATAAHSRTISASAAARSIAASPSSAISSTSAPSTPTSSPSTPRTGAVRWDTVVADYKLGYSITVAPLAVKDKIIIGVAGGEYGARGFLDAYNARASKPSWRFWTVPGPGEPGNETWKGDSWKMGAADTWVAGAFDPATNLIYSGTHKIPAPTGTATSASATISTLTPSSPSTPIPAKLKWHFQFTPHDVHDWDATEVPVLVDGEVRGEKRKLLPLPQSQRLLITSSTASPASSSSASPTPNKPGPRASTTAAAIRVEGTTPTLQGVKVVALGRRRQ
jgi:alcohol dehydrogenase (cytochrome c)